MFNARIKAVFFAVLLICATALPLPSFAGQSCAFTASPVITPTRAATAPVSSTAYEINYNSTVPGSTFSFSYDDRYFTEDAAADNLPLAHTSMALSSTVYDQGKTAAALLMLGFQDVWEVDADKQATPWDNNFIGLFIARKTIITDGKNLDLFAVVCRGTCGLEWLSNFNLGRDERQPIHLGFGEAADRALCALNTYVSACGTAGAIDDDPTNNAVWVMGHSRGGAVANLMGASLNRESSGAPKDKIFAYTFAAPNVSRGPDEHRSGYENIRNYINPRDIITRVPLSGSGWGYWRYGQDITMSLRVERQVAQRFNRYSALPYQPFNYLTLEIILAALHKVAPTWQDYYGVQKGYEAMQDTPPSLAGAFEVLAYILANVPTGSSTLPDDVAAWADDPIGRLMERIFPGGQPPPELEHAHTLHTYVLFLEILAEQAQVTSAASRD